MKMFLDFDLRLSLLFFLARKVKSGEPVIEAVCFAGSCSYMKLSKAIVFFVYRQPNVMYNNREN